MIPVEYAYDDTILQTLITNKIYLELKFVRSSLIILSRIHNICNNYKYFINFNIILIN